MTLQEIQALVNAKISEFLEKFISEPENLFEPITYTMEGNGKRVRPTLCLLAANLFVEPKELEKFLPAALAIEVFHNFTLLHDDLMDNSAKRRNKATVHTKYGANAAILSGDAMMILAYKILELSPKEHLPKLLDLFSNTALQVCQGQQLDMNYEQSWDVTLDQYLKMIELKTAVMFAASLKMGALLANASESIQDLLFDIGINLGIAFQIHDDLLDIYADTTSFGKPIGGDIIEGKKTFLLLSAMQQLPPEEQYNLENIFFDPSLTNKKRISIVTSIYNDLAVRDIALMEIEKLYDKSLADLEQVATQIPRKEAIKPLRDLIERLLQRVR